MKVLTITEGYPPDRGGGSTYAYEIPRRMAKYKAETLVLAKSADIKHKDKKHPKVSVFRIEFPEYKKAGITISLKRIRFILKMLKIAANKQEDYDIVHLHSGFGAKVIAWSLKNIYRIKKPVVMTFHGTFIGNYGAFYPFPISKIFDIVSRGLMLGANCDKYIVVDDGTHAERVLEGKVPRSKMRKHYHAVDCEKFKPKKIRKKGKIITFIGRLDPFKGIEIFIKSIPDICRRYDNVKFLLVGDGPLRAELEALVENLGIKTKVKFIGSVPHSKIPYYINLSDCLVFPDVRAFENRDYFNLAMSEAMACGALYLSSSYPRKEWKCKTWIPIEKPEPSEISTKLLKVLQAPKQYDKIRKNARKVALEYFNWAKVVKLYYNEFLSLTNRE